MLAKLLTVMVAASSVGLVVYGTSEPGQPTPSQPAQIAARPATAPALTVPALITPPALARPAANLQIVRPPVVMGPYTIPYTIHLTITGVSNPQLSFLVGLTAPLDWADTGAWIGNVQLPQGGITFVFAFLYAQKVPDFLPWCDVCACAGGRDAGGAFDPRRGLLAMREYRKATSMTPIQIVGRMQGGSIFNTGLTTVDYVIQP